MQKDSKNIAAAYLNILNEGMHEELEPHDGHDVSDHDSLKDKLKHLIHQSSLSEHEKQQGLQLLGLEEDEEHNYERDRTDQDRNDKSAIDHAREDAVAAERDHGTKGQGVDGKFHF